MLALYLLLLLSVHLIKTLLGQMPITHFIIFQAWIYLRHIMPEVNYLPSDSMKEAAYTLPPFRASHIHLLLHVAMYRIWLCIIILHLFWFMSGLHSEWLTSYISRLNVTHELPWFSLYVVSTSAAVLPTGDTNISKNVSPSQNTMSIKFIYDCSESLLNVFLANVKTSLKGGKIYFGFTFAIPRHMQSF